MRCHGQRRGKILVSEWGLPPMRHLTAVTQSLDLHHCNQACRPSGVCVEAFKIIENKDFINNFDPTAT
jgi:hypothetical protein